VRGRDGCRQLKVALNRTYVATNAQQYVRFDAAQAKVDQNRDTHIGRACVRACVCVCACEGENLWACVVHACACACVCM
jgi:hypothetical protein